MVKSNTLSSSFSLVPSKQTNTILRSDLKIDKVSQEERDAAHNLVCLHMQSNKRSRSNSSNSFSTHSDSLDSVNTDNTAASHDTVKPTKPQIHQNNSLSEKQPKYFKYVQSAVYSKTTGIFPQTHNHHYNNNSYNSNHMCRTQPNNLHYNEARCIEFVNPVSAIGECFAMIAF